MCKKKRGEVETFWDNCFKSTNLPSETFPERDFAPIISRLARHGTRSVLDLGCGLGHWARALARAGFRLKAVDISREAVRRARELAKSEGLSIDTGVCAARDVSTTERFDAVISNSLLDHMSLEDAEATVRKIKLILNEGGVVFLSFDGPEEDEVGGEGTFTLLSDGTRRYIKGRHKGMLWRFYTDDEIRLLVRGFEIMEFTERDNGRREVWVRKVIEAES